MTIWACLGAIPGSRSGRSDVRSAPMLNGVRPTAMVLSTRSERSISRWTGDRDTIPPPRAVVCRGEYDVDVDAKQTTESGAGRREIDGRGGRISGAARRPPASGEAGPPPPDGVAAAPELMLAPGNKAGHRRGTPDR